jgi:DNA-binding IclR family transcriptional regulator
MTTETETKILEALAGRAKPWSYRELSESTGFPVSTLRDAFMALRRRRLVTYTPGKHRTMRITPRGLEEIT